jgi:hypothetical protein
MSDLDTIISSQGRSLTLFGYTAGIGPSGNWVLPVIPGTSEEFLNNPEPVRSQIEAAIFSYS